MFSACTQTSQGQSYLMRRAALTSSDISSRGGRSASSQPSSLSSEPSLTSLEYAVDIFREFLLTDLSVLLCSLFYTLDSEL